MGCNGSNNIPKWLYNSKITLTSHKYQSKKGSYLKIKVYITLAIVAKLTNPIL